MDGTDPASTRDPFGRVVHRSGQVFRVITREGALNDAALRARGIFAELENAGLLIGSRPADPRDGIDIPEGGALLEHPTLPMVSYPYEWSFSALQAAAIHHLDLQIAALDSGVTLTDASAYNVQFQGTIPLFIDVTSLKPREDGEYWRGYRQFREQFLNPLALTHYSGLPFNALYTGSINGVAATYLRHVLRLHQLLRPMALLHILLPDMLGRREGAAKPNRQMGLSAEGFREILGQLRRWIASTKPRWQASAWSRYGVNLPYRETEAAAKQSAVSRAVGVWQPDRLLDLGCNTGAFSLAAWKAGAKLVVGIDSDPQSVNLAFRAAREAKADMLPLVVDLMDPSPARGWRGTERRSLIDRARPDTVMALALAHHVAVTGLPLPTFLDWLVEVAPRGIVEFVPLEDPMLAGMVASRGGMVLRDYSRETFLDSLARLARIEHCETLTQSGRLLAIYDRQ